MPIIYEVERLRDGRSFTTRRVTAIQHGQAIFSMIDVVPCRGGDGFDHQDQMPDVPPPDKLSAEEIVKQPFFKEMPEFIKRYLRTDRPIELRPVELDRYFGRRSADGRIHVWIRTAADCRTIRRSISARSPMPPTSRCSISAMARYGRTLFDKRIMPAEPRPRDVVSPPVPGRRMAALCPGLAERAAAAAASPAA